MRDVDLDVFLHPRSVAVVGASDASRKPNTLMTARIKAFADANGAAFYPVTPSYPEVQGVATYASIADVPGDIDLAVLLTGAERVVDNFEEAVHKKAKFAVIFSAGFSEIGPAARRSRPARRARARAATPACSARTPTSTPSPTSAPTSPGPRSRS